MEQSSAYSVGMRSIPTRFAFLVVLLFAFAVSAAAQQSPYGAKLLIYNVGATTPVQTTTAPASAATCGMTPSPDPVGDAVNPRVLEYTDPSNAAKVCQVQLAAFFGGLPVGQRQEGRVAFVDEAAGLESDPSAVSNPFVRRTPPPPPARVRILRGGGQ